MLEDDSDLEPIKDPQLLFTMALDLEEEKQYVKMGQALLRLLEIEPEQEDVWYGLGIALGQQGKLDEAVAAYREQIKVKPDDENAWYNLGSALSKSGNLDQAQLAYAQALQLNSQDLDTLSADAELALVQQDTHRCYERIQQALVWVDNKTQHYAILPFLAWLADPESSHQPVLDAIQNLDPAVKINWNFSDTEPAIARLNPEQQQIARQFAAYFEGKSQDLSNL